jgi:YihY family inner membrane protein
MSVSGRLDAFQRRHKVLGFPIACIYKFTDDQGNYLAALITYYAFIALFPLLLLATSILGFVLAGNPDLQQKVLDSALSQFPVIGDELARQGGIQGSTTAVIIGALGSLYGALGVAQATQNAMNVAWAVPKNRRPNPILIRLRSVALLSIAGVGIMATTFVTTLGSDLDALGTNIDQSLRWILAVVTILVNSAVFVFVFRLATTHQHSLRKTIPGAVTTAVLWQILQLAGTMYVTEVIAHSRLTNQIFATIFGMIAYLYLAAIFLVFGAEINVVKAHRLYPRALLTPFTDNVDLTNADRRAYADYAAAQRTKEFEQVEVTFEHGGQYRSAKEAARQEGVDDFHDPSPASVDDSTSGRPHDHH